MVTYKDFLAQQEHYRSLLETSELHRQAKAGERMSWFAGIRTGLMRLALPRRHGAVASQPACC